MIIHHLYNSKASSYDSHVDLILLQPRCHKRIGHPDVYRYVVLYIYLGKIVKMSLAFMWHDTLCCDCLVITRLGVNNTRYVPRYSRHL
jgi:hypothetical protein